MRMIILLATLLIVGLLVARQLNLGSSTTTGTGVETTEESNNSNPPRVPTRPQDVQAFGEQMNKFINDTASERKQRIEQEQQ
ncbi:hypothetical protein [Sedimenticola hydrogenitrophicus]|uniref:hypothetical protein n=1 Tax=Sedimenticola hydrogenitrophicus TaxID=2967975 RepID=UPI0021A6FFE2|nr:hypothetical protein [Sedimenticola hydrogenitrophicus]